MKKDKLDKTIEELQVGFKGTTSMEKPIVNAPLNPFEPTPQVGVRDTYLPFVLVKLKICSSNTEARKMISSGLVKVNNNVTTKTYETSQLSNFLLEVNKQKFEIFKLD